MFRCITLKAGRLLGQAGVCTLTLNTTILSVTHKRGKQAGRDGREQDPRSRSDGSWDLWGDPISWPMSNSSGVNVLQLCSNELRPEERLHCCDVFCIHQLNSHTHRSLTIRPSALTLPSAPENAPLMLLKDIIMLWCALMRTKGAFHIFQADIISTLWTK